MQLTEQDFEARTARFPESVFFKYSNFESALASFTRKDASPMFNSDELFMFEVIGKGFVVQTTGSLQKLGA